MLGCACKREHLKRRSMARWLRASSSISASHSSVAATLRFLVAASEIVVSSWRLIVDRLSWSSFSGSVIGFLSGIKNESVVGQQRQRIGDEFVQPRVAETKRWLRPPRRLLLAEDVGDVVGAEGASGICFGDGAGHCLRSILPDQFQQFVELARQHTVAIGHATQITLGYVGGAEAVEKIEEASLRL